MLVEFSFKNFKSFRDEATLSMVASKDDSLPQNVIGNAQGTGLDLLKSVLIYGANASGKSNVIEALKFMSRFVEESVEGERETPINRDPFGLDEVSEGLPTQFCATFIQEGEIYNYGFNVSSREVVGEWLFQESVRRKLLFRRDNQQNFSFGSAWKGVAKRLIPLVRRNTLLLSVASQFNHDIAQTVFNWFRLKNKYLSNMPEYGGERFFTDRLCYENKGVLPHVVNFLKAADLGIEKFSVDEVPIDEVQEFKNMPVEIRTVLFKEASKDSRTLTRNLFHDSCLGSSVPLDWTKESTGTRRMYSISGPFLTVLENGYLLCADEFDGHLHPNLTRWLFRFFQEKSTEAQLIVATHQDSFFDMDLFRRDQFWLTEKDPSTGASVLYSLWDFKKPRKQESLRKGYLAGKYGGVPFIPGRAVGE